MIFATLTLNILLGVVCLGFVLTVWGGSLPSGPEGPVGAWIVPVPFLLILLVVMISSILRGRFDWIPGGKLVAFALLFGFMVGVGAPLFDSFNRHDSGWDYVIATIPFVTLVGCFWAVSGLEPMVPARAGKILASAILGLTSAGGWGLTGYAFVTHLKREMLAADRHYAKDRVEQEARTARQTAEFRALPADAPLIELFGFEFAANEEVQREARQRIAARPDLDGEIIAILSDEKYGVTDLLWTVSYIANIHPAPPARLAPAYAKVLERAYKYWESTMKYDDYASKAEPEVLLFLRGAERVQKAGGDLRPQLRAWRDLVKSARGPGGLAAYLKSIANA